MAPNGDLLDKDSNPLTYVAASSPPFLIMHGSRDRVISPSQTLILHEALLHAGAQSIRYVLDGANHGDLSFLGDTQSGLPWSSTQTMDIIVAFLKKQLPEKRP